MAFSEAIPSAPRVAGVQSTRLVATAWIHCKHARGSSSEGDLFWPKVSSADAISTPEGALRLAIVVGLGWHQQVWLGELEGDAYRAAMRNSREAVLRAAAVNGKVEVDKEVDLNLAFREVATCPPQIIVMHSIWLTGEVLLLVGVSKVMYVAGLREVRGSLLFFLAPSFAESPGGEQLAGGWRLKREAFTIRLPVGVGHLDDVSVRSSLGHNQQNVAVGWFVRSNVGG